MGWSWCVDCRIGDIGGLEAFAAEDARVALFAGSSLGVWVVAGVGDGIVEAEAYAGFDDVGFGQVDEGCDDFEWSAFDGGFGGEVGGVLETLDEVWSAVGVAGVVDGVDAEPDFGGAADFGQGGGQGEEDEVAGGDIGDGDVG